MQTPATLSEQPHNMIVIINIQTIEEHIAAKHSYTCHTVEELTKMSYTKLQQLQESVITIYNEDIKGR